MARRSDAALATLALTSRVVSSAVAPFKASEFWRLTESVAPGSLVGRDGAAIVAELGDDLGGRVVQLLERASALAFALEELDQRGVRVLTAFDDDYPQRWRTCLGAAAPPVIHVAGPVALLARDALAVVGSRAIGTDAEAVARAAGRLAAEHGLVLVSGGAQGTDRAAMQGALDAGGVAVGVVAEPITRLARDVAVRRSIVDEQLCIATPYAPDAAFTAAGARGRNKLIYALAPTTFVVASDNGRGGTWSGATEALERSYGHIAVWRGAGEGPGNAGLVARGARLVERVEQLLM